MGKFVKRWKFIDPGTVTRIWSFPGEIRDSAITYSLEL
ncbi:hypothetical protein LINPERHAP1_LOCUS22439 [Linum perenne]